jgi:hypothetical protein
MNMRPEIANGYSFFGYLDDCASHRGKTGPIPPSRIVKQGRTARSFRTILGAVSVKSGHQFSLEIVEDAKPTWGTKSDRVAGQLLNATLEV